MEAFENNTIPTSNKSMMVKEIFTGHKSIPMDMANKAMKSVCKIKIKVN